MSSQPFDWEAAAGALEGWIASTPDAPPVLWGMAARMRVTRTPTVIFEWAGPVEEIGQETETNGNAPEMSPPVGDEIVTTDAKTWRPTLQLCVVAKPSDMRGSKAPMAVLLRLLTALSTDPVNNALMVAGLGYQGTESIEAGIDQVGKELQPFVVAELKIQLREQVDIRVGYLTGAVMTQTVVTQEGTLPPTTYNAPGP